jgi:hypothetical protein
MLDKQVLITVEKHAWDMLFLPQEVVWHEVFKEETITKDNIHEERCSRLLIQLSGCNMLLNYNLWFKGVEIKTKEGLLQYLINYKESLVWN